MPKTNKIFGKWGEDQAEIFLQKRGYEILDRNYQKRCGEIDIVTRLKQTLHFIEVKTRKKSSVEKYGAGEEAVDMRKQKKLIETAYHYLSEKKFPEDTDWQIDVISITYSTREEKVNIRHIQNAFDEN
jgi:putative endonuclease